MAVSSLKIGILLLVALTFEYGNSAPSKQNPGQLAQVMSSQGRIERKLEVIVTKIQALRSDGNLKCRRDRNIFDFESGSIFGWTSTGTAFNSQPTFGDNTKARHPNSPSRHNGLWWIGTYESRPSPSAIAGTSQGDGPKGTLTSPRFVIRGTQLSFLIGGGCDINHERAELLIGGNAVRRATGRCLETMTRVYWNVAAYRGRMAQVRLVDTSSGSWGHINFDHLVDVC